MNRVKIRGARGPFCLSHTDTVLVPKLRPPTRWLATIAPSQSLDVRIIKTEGHLHRLTRFYHFGFTIH